ncbi:hypothetical protein CEW46_21245 [Bacillus cereus]|nr:hypothetical protein CEW46_21245 [Bacillus cereus]
MRWSKKLLDKLESQEENLQLYRWTMYIAKVLHGRVYDVTEDPKKLLLKLFSGETTPRDLGFWSHKPLEPLKVESILLTYDDPENRLEFDVKIVVDNPERLVIEFNVNPGTKTLSSKEKVACYILYENRIKMTTALMNDSERVIPLIKDQCRDTIIDLALLTDLHVSYDPRFDKFSIWHKETTGSNPDRLDGYVRDANTLKKAISLQNNLKSLLTLNKNTFLKYIEEHLDYYNQSYTEEWKEYMLW